MNTQFYDVSDDDNVAGIGSFFSSLGSGIKKGIQSDTFKKSILPAAIGMVAAKFTPQPQQQAAQPVYQQAPMPQGAQQTAGNVAGALGAGAGGVLDSIANSFGVTPQTVLLGGGALLVTLFMRPPR